jgi:hypothetical protein
MAQASDGGKPRRTGPFGPAGEILPKNQLLERLRPDDTMLDALKQLCEGGFNQAPVTEGRECLGVIRLFEVVKGLLQERWFRDKMRDLKVRNHVDLQPRYIGLDEWVDIGFDWQQDDLAMVGTPSDLKGMLTATDILGRLTDYAQAFMHIEAIEHDTRELFDLQLPLPEYEALILEAITSTGKPPPRSLVNYDQFEFWQYAMVFGREATFARLQDVCIWCRAKVVQRIEAVAPIRNDLLHFRARPNSEQVSQLEELAKHAASTLARAHARRS